MRKLALCAVVVLAFGCGGEGPIEENDQEPVVRDGTTIGMGQTKQLSAGGVEFSILRTAIDRGVLIAYNTNSNGAEVLVQRIDGTGTALDESYISAGGLATNTDFTLDDGIRYRFKVRVWKQGLDLITCPFTEESCYSTSEVKEANFLLPPTPSV